MLVRTKLTIAGLLLSLTPFGVVALGQQTQTTDPPTNVQRSRAGQAGPAARRRLPPIMRALRQLNLTDAQKQQARAIVQSGMEGTKTQRQEMHQLTRQWRQGTLAPEGLARAKEVRKLLQDANKGMRTQLVAILTPEQKTKLEEMIKARRANRGIAG